MSPVQFNALRVSGIASVTIAVVTNALNYRQSHNHPGTIMKQILIACVFLLVLMIAVIGSLAIFGIMEVGDAVSTALKFGAAIVLVGACSTLLSVVFRGR